MTSLLARIADAVESIAETLSGDSQDIPGGGRVSKQALDIGDVTIVDDKGQILTEWKKP